MTTINSSKLIRARIKFMTTYRVPPTMTTDAIRQTEGVEKISPIEMKEIRDDFAMDRRNMLRELSDLYSANQTESLSSLISKMANRDRHTALEL